MLIVDNVKCGNEVCVLCHKAHHLQSVGVSNVILTLHSLILGCPVSCLLKLRTAVACFIYALSSIKPKIKSLFKVLWY
jgi:hypothetical protein